MYVLISKAACNTYEKDSYVNENIDRYIEEIWKIKNMMESGKLSATKKIGDFYITPRGHKRERIAWFKERDKIIIADFFVHDDRHKKFCKLAANRKIKREDYVKGVIPLETNFEEVYSKYKEKEK